MADYYTQFSCLLDVSTPENAARALELYNALSRENATEDPPSDGFALSIQPEHGGTVLWMRDDGTGDPAHVLEFVRRCAAAFGLTKSNSGRESSKRRNVCTLIPGPKIRARCRPAPLSDPILPVGLHRSGSARRVHPCLRRIISNRR